MGSWLAVCAVDDIAVEDVRRFQHDGAEYAIYRLGESEFHATAGHCTHEKMLLCEGIVEGDEIECPKHYGRFDIRSGQALGAPVFIGLETFPVKIEAGTVYLEVT